MTDGVRIPDLAGWDLGERSCAYAERDVILYALAVGAAATDLDLVYETRLHVLPTFPLTLGLWAVRAAGAVGAYDPATTLHVGQALSVHAPLPPAGAFDMRATIANVWDKGTAALVEVNVACEFFDALYTIYIPGAGGFGGERGSRAASGPPDAPADVTTTVTTSPNQAALYRLTGDPHPVHIDPAAAQAVGFDRPILHGLCTLGSVALAVGRAIDRDPRSLTYLDARLSAPVYPGSTLDVEAWTGGTAFSYRASVARTGPVLIGEGRFSG